jgi:hypothetical protein
MNSGEFLATRLKDVDDALSGAILNRNRWNGLCEERRLLQFLEARRGAPDFSSVEAELHRIADGRANIPGISGPRRKATDCLRDWADSLKQLNLESMVENSPVPVPDVESGASPEARRSHKRSPA